MQELQLHKHTCSTCGDEKEVLLAPEENVEDLEGCVCDKTPERMQKKGMISADSLLNFSK